MPVKKGPADAPDLGPQEKVTDAIQKAYEDQLSALFKVLVSNLAARDVSRDTEKECLDEFTRGLKLTMRAKELALKAIAAAPVSSSPASRSEAASQQMTPGGQRSPAGR